MTGDLVVCSLEAWDNVWRRNQFLVRELLEIRPSSRVLFVAPASDRLQRLIHHSGPAPGPLRAMQTGRLWQLTPSKVWPRVLGPFADHSLFRQVRNAVSNLKLMNPILWINDSVYAGLATATGWSTVYDITDDWLQLSMPAREMRRRQQRESVLLEKAAEVVVCSEALARDRGACRNVHLIPNAVDVAHFRKAMARPADLPAQATAVYLGTLHDERLDIDLIVDLAESAPALTIVLVGPNCLRPSTIARLEAMANVRLVGPKPYADVPGYLQHATVIVVPHRLTPFTESLDPIKAYECLAVGTPTVATPVSGFRLGQGSIQVAPREAWVATVIATVSGAVPCSSRAGTVPTWRDRALAFDRVLSSAHGGRLDPSRVAQ